MNKLVLVVVGGILIVGGATYIFAQNKDDSSPNQSANQNVATGDSALIAVDACDVLTDAAAKQVLGQGATKGDTSAGEASSDDVSVSNCIYTYQANPGGSIQQQLQDTTTASVLARAARTKTGADSNKAVFDAQKPAGVQDVSGYGDKAYWNPQFAQLNVLKGNNWYIISNYTGTSPSKATLDEAKKLADAIKPNLK